MYLTIRVIISFCLLSLISCTTEKNKPLALGEISIQIHVDQSNFFTTDLSVTNTDKFSVKILNLHSGETVASFQQLNDVPSRLFLTQGQYKVIATSPQKNKGDLVFKGSKRFTIIKDNATILNVNCLSQNEDKTVALLSR